MNYYLSIIAFSNLHFTSFKNIRYPLHKIPIPQNMRTGLESHKAKEHLLRTLKSWGLVTFDSHLILGLLSNGLFFSVF